MASKSSGSPKRHGMMAVFLGTALATLGSGQARAEVLQQEVDGISRYCTVCWRNARLPVDRWGDCTQEVFRRLLERVPTSAWKHVLTGDSDERREFLRAIDAVKKRSQRDLARGTFLAAEVADHRGQKDLRLQDELESFHRASTEVLSARQQRILQRVCEGCSLTEMARELDMTCERVSDEKYKAIKKLQKFFQNHPELS